VINSPQACATSWVAAGEQEDVRPFFGSLMTAIVTLERLEQHQFLSAGTDGHADAIRQLRRALVTNECQK